MLTGQPYEDRKKLINTEEHSGDLKIYLSISFRMTEAEAKMEWVDSIKNS